MGFVVVTVHASCVGPASCMSRPQEMLCGSQVDDVVSNGKSSEGFQGGDVVHRDHWCRTIIAAFLMLPWNTPLQPHLELQKQFPWEMGRTVLYICDGLSLESIAPRFFFNDVPGRLISMK